jgi:uncharacterized protein (DUF1499 family)
VPKIAGREREEAMSETMATTSPSGRFSRRLLSLAILLAVVAVVLLAIGPVGWRAGWWHFRVAFFWLMPGAAYCGIAAVVVSAVALALGRRTLAWRRFATGVAALVIGGVIAYVPWGYDQMRGMLPNDITTDLGNPPSYVAVLPIRKATNAPNDGEYKPAKAEQQRRNYPDIAPVMLDVAPDKAFPRALVAVQQLGWVIVATDAETGRIEASESTRWFHFTDDVVIRVAPSGAGSRVDIRSSSRYGTGDFGVNVRRVRRYIAALRGTS